MLICKHGLPGKCRLFARTILEKGCSIGYHEHVNETEFFYFTKGRGKVNDDGEEYVVKAGDAYVQVAERATRWRTVPMKHLNL